METRGRRFDEIPHTSLHEHGFSINAIKTWRKQKFDAGRPSRLEDFYRVHGLCFDCRCTGARMVGWDEEVPLWITCSTCQGTGAAESTKWQTWLVLDAIRRLPDSFGIADVEQLCPEVTVGLIRVLLIGLKTKGQLTSETTEFGDVWRKRDSSL